MERKQLLEILNDLQCPAVMHEFTMEELADYLTFRGVIMPVRCEECEMHGVCATEQQLKQMGQKPEEAFCSFGSRRGSYGRG